MHLSRFTITMYYCVLFLFQLIQTISAVDTDEPLIGHKFIFTLSTINPNFTIIDNEGKHAKMNHSEFIVVALHSGTKGL